MINEDRLMWDHGMRGGRQNAVTQVCLNVLDGDRGLCRWVQRRAVEDHGWASDTGFLVIGGHAPSVRGNTNLEKSSASDGSSKTGLAAQLQWAVVVGVAAPVRTCPGDVEDALAWLLGMSAVDPRR